MNLGVKKLIQKKKLQGGLKSIESRLERKLKMNWKQTYMLLASIILEDLQLNYTLAYTFFNKPVCNQAEGPYNTGKEHISG